MARSPSSAPAGGVRIHHVTPRSAGWTHAGFETYDRPAGGRIARDMGDREGCVVMISGRTRIGAGAQGFGTVGERASLFEGLPWSVYVPARSSPRLAEAGNRITPPRSAAASPPHRRRPRRRRTPPAGP